MMRWGRLLLTAVGWLSITAVLLTVLPTAAVPIVLGVLVTGEALAALFLHVQAPNGRRRGDAISTLLLAWLALCAGVMALSYGERLILFQGYPFAPICLLGFALGIGLLRLLDAGGASRPTLLLILSDARWMLASSALLYADGLVELDGDLALAFLLFVTLSILTLSAILHRRNLSELRVGEGYAVPKTVQIAGFADILLVSLALSGGDALIYLLARGVALGVSACITQLTTQAWPMLEGSTGVRYADQFVARAARLNLGVMLIGGALGLAGLTVAPFIAQIAGLSERAFQDVLLWTLLAALAPVVFGAADVLLQALRQRVTQALINLGATAVLLALALGAYEVDALFLAQAAAGAALIRHGASAIYLIHIAGVWPGPTALLLKRIRLL